MATLTVGDGGYASISDAITAAVDGDTILVMPGTWTLPPSINKALTFVGANAGISANDSDGSLNSVRGAETIIDGGSAPSTLVIQTGGPVTFDGFTFIHQNFQSSAIDSDIALLNNVISGPIPRVLIVGNSPDTITVQNNHITGVVGDPSFFDSFFVAGDWNGTTGTQVNFTGNVITDSPDALGLNLSNVAGTIANNIFNGIADYGVMLANNTDVDVTGNVFANIVNRDPSVTPTWGSGVRTYDPGAFYDLNIDGNIFTGNYAGIGVRLGSDVAPGAVTITNNVFSGNGHHIIHQGTAATDILIAGNNTFDSVLLSDATDAQLLALADQIIDGVDDGAYGFVVLKPGHIYLTENSFFAPGTTEPSLQRAIDGTVAGDVIHVGAGTYAGLATVTVDNLTVTTAAGAIGLAVVLGPGVANITLAGDGNIDVTGNDSANVIAGNSGGNVIDGGLGHDTVTFSGARTQYRVDLLMNGDIQVTDWSSGAPVAVDTIRDVESFMFADSVFTAAAVLNDTPVDITLSGTSVAEMSADGTVLGTLAASDVDPGETFTFSLVDDAGGRFAISGSDLVVANGVAIDFEQASSLRVTVRVTDSGGLTFDKEFDIGVTDVDPEVVGGTASPDFIVGGTGDDTINGGEGPDTVFGGAGGDLLGGGGGDDIVVGGDGDDTLWGEDGDDVLGGNEGSDTSLGGDGSDLLGGDGGNDVLSGGDGNDVLFGGVGDDQLSGGSDEDIIVGDDGNDVIWGEDGNDIANGGAGNDVILGGAGDDQIGGGAGNDGLSGGDGNDSLWGEDGDDFLAGDAGDDTLVGMAGNDIYVFTAGDGNDTINDFAAGGSEDAIWLIGTNLTSFDEVLANAAYDAGTGTTTITYTGGSIALRSVTPDALTAGDFIFS